MKNCNPCEIGKVAIASSASFAFAFCFGLGALNCNWILHAFELNPCLKDIKSLKKTKLAIKLISSIANSLT